MRRYSNLNDYVFDCQLEHFSTMNKEEEVFFGSIQDDGFEMSSKWKPIVSSHQVKEYSKENWD